jgi:Flagellar transcriptional activator (FlhC)
MGSVDRYTLIRRKYDLAQRMIVLGARTSTVMHWTGLSEYRVQQLARRFVPKGSMSRRGHPPHTPRYFARSPRIEAESLAFVYLAMEADVVPREYLRDSRNRLAELHRGERLLDVFECYLALTRAVDLTLERAITLLYAFTSREQISLRDCVECGDQMLTQRSARDIRCPFCRKDPAPSGGSPSHRGALLVNQLGSSDAIEDAPEDNGRRAR